MCHTGRLSHFDNICCKIFASCAFEKFLRHTKSKFDGNAGVLQRKCVRISSIAHIGKESNGLDESELFGLDDFSYETYCNKSEIDEKFRKIALRILELKPKDVKEIGISKQTLWNIKNQIKNKAGKIKQSTKIKFLHADLQDES